MELKSIIFLSMQLISSTLKVYILLKSMPIVKLINLLSGNVVCSLEWFLSSNIMYSKTLIKNKRLLIQS